jgi:glutaconyl-CoA decarboxylase
MTNNPLLILIINMTVVFFVLFVLEILTRAIYFIDPTRKKGVAAPAAAKPAVNVDATLSPSTETSDDMAIVAIITAAIAAMGGSVGHIGVIRRIDGASWTQMGRIDALNTRSQMY